VLQAEDRDHGEIRDIKSYFAIRRENTGLKPSYAIIEVHLNLPERVHSDPIIERLYLAAVDLILIANDVYSYNIEYVHAPS
jgi:hypothetical protein